MTPAPQPQWTDDEVMKEIEDAFDRGVAAAEAIIDMKKHDAFIAAQAREEVLDDVAQYAQKHGGLYTINGFKGSVPCLSLHPLIVFINSLRDNLLQKHAAAIAAQARDKTLTDVLKALDDVVLIDENNQYYLWLEDAECAVESLRTQSQEHP